MSPSMLNPKNRPVLGIYSDEGVGYERGGRSLLGGKVHPAFDISLQQQEQQSNPNQFNAQCTGSLSGTTTTTTTTNSLIPPLPIKKRNYVVFHALKSAEEQSQELAQRWLDAENVNQREATP